MNEWHNLRPIWLKKDFTAETITSNYRPSSPYKTCIRNLLLIKNETATYEAEWTQE